MNKKLASASILTAGTLWGIIALFVRALSANDFTSMEIAALRSFGALFLMFVGLLICKRELLKIKLKDVWCFIGTGVLSLTFFNWCYFKTMVLTSLSVAAILLYTAPAIVVVLSAIFFKEKITKSKVGCLCIAFAGCAFVTGVFSGGDSGLSPLGLLIGLGAGFGYALYSIFGRYAIQRGYSSFTITFYTFFFSSLGTLPLIEFGHLRQSLASIDGGKGMLLIAGFALISTVLPYLLYTLGLTGVESGKASIMASIEPVVATILGIVVYGERLTVQGLIGIIMVLGAIVMLNIQES